MRMVAFLPTYLIFLRVEQKKKKKKKFRDREVLRSVLPPPHHILLYSQFAVIVRNSQSRVS